jgi:hypothetical protein
MNEHRRNTVILSAWVDPVLRDYAREAAKAAGMPFSAWVGRAVQQALSRESAERAAEAAFGRGECSACGYVPCLCDQQ